MSGASLAFRNRTIPYHYLIVARIAVIHSYYSSREPSGENLAVESEITALRRAGHDVAVIARRTDDLQSEVGYPVRSAFRVATGHGASGRRQLDDFRPDLVRVHNLFPNFGRRWLGRLDAPYVAILHNYRPLCANGYLFRSGELCTLCPDGRRWSGVRHGCFHGSALTTLPVAIGNRRGVDHDAVLRGASRVFALTEGQRDVYRRFGFDHPRFEVWPNFLPDDLDPGDAGDGRVEDSWLYVGRLSPEKGVLRLVREWPASAPPLVVMGAGPERAAVEAAAAERRNVEFAGRVDRGEVLDRMRQSIGLVLPSLWFEGLPLVYVEALAAGLPVLVIEPCAIAAEVERDGTGWSTDWAHLASAVELAATTRSDVAPRCRMAFERAYTERIFRERVVQLLAEFE
jgi:glycosyltransferase involved in cell wall biosynthesis